MSGYDFHPQARFDLDEIWEFIRADSLDAADRVITENSVRHSRPGSISPSRPQAPGPQLTALRFIRVREYLIAYAPDEKPLWVVAVMHGRAALA